MEDDSEPVVGRIMLSVARGSVPFFFVMMAVLVAAGAAQQLSDLTILPFLVAIFIAGSCAGFLGSVYATILSSGVLMGTPLATIELHASVSTFWFGAGLVICLASLVRWAMGSVREHLNSSLKPEPHRLRSLDKNGLARHPLSWQARFGLSRHLRSGERDELA